MRTTVDTRMAARQLRIFMDRVGPEGEKLLLGVVRDLGRKGRIELRNLTPSGQGRRENRRRLRQNVTVKVTRAKDRAGASAFVFYSRRGLRWQQPLAVEHGAQGRPGRHGAAQALENVAGPTGEEFRTDVLRALESAADEAGKRARLRRTRR